MTWYVRFTYREGQGRAQSGLLDVLLPFPFEVGLCKTIVVLLASLQGSNPLWRVPEARYNSSFATACVVEGLKMRVRRRRRRRFSSCYVFDLFASAQVRRAELTGLLPSQSSNAHAHAAIYLVVVGESLNGKLSSFGRRYWKLSHSYITMDDIS